MSIPIIGGQKKQSKPTTKEILDMIGALAQQVHGLQMSLHNSDKALNEYIEYKKDAEPFMAYLKEKYEVKEEDDNTDKKNKDK